MPFTQLFEQHCPSLKQPNVPSLMHPHCPLVHLLEQQVEFWKHWAPSAAQAAVHIPLLHVPEQHSVPCAHVVPEGLQFGAPQKPCTQLLEQHC